MNRLTTKRYERFFKDNDLEEFDKVKVALEIIKNLKVQKKTDENELGNTVDNFEILFLKIKEKFGSKGINL